MIPVFLCGNQKDTGMINVLLSAIHTFHASALYVTVTTVSLLPPDATHADFLILDDNNVCRFNFSEGIILFKNDVTGCETAILPKDFIAVVESDNEKALELLKRNAMQTITCGLSSKDTLTFSSIDTEKAVVSLQREINALNGDSILPHEVTLKLGSFIEKYPVLAAVAAMLLSGFSFPENAVPI